MNLNYENIKKTKSNLNYPSELFIKKVLEDYNKKLRDNKFLIITSKIPIVHIKLKLKDLISRFKNFLLFDIPKPDEELMFALILKNLSDRQITVDKKLINYIVKRIDRSYSKIFDFIYKVDELSLKKKKPIDFKIIKEVLGE